MNNTQYDSIAKLYQESKKLSFRENIEMYTLFNILGSISNKNVIDLACGDGFYTRKIKKAGASKVIGVDISGEMIGLALEEEAQSPLGCNYVNKDAAKLQLDEKFDFVIAMYLLNYAKTRSELLNYVESAFNLLKSGSMFVGYNENAKYLPEIPPSYDKYGFTKKYPRNIKEGDLIFYHMINDDNTEFEFQCYFHKKETYSWAFQKAGFVDFQWIGPYLNPSQKSNSFWSTFMAY